MVFLAVKDAGAEISFVSSYKNDVSSERQSKKSMTIKFFSEKIYCISS